MTRDLSPTERLTARLAAMAGTGATGIAPTSPDGLATKYIKTADDKFSDPMSVITVRWTRQEHPFLFSRAVHEFDDYEAFIFKLSIVMAGMALLDHANAEVLAGVAVYAGGKAIVQRDGPRPTGYRPANYDELETKGRQNQLPGSLPHYATEINSLIQRARQAGSHVLSLWISKHVGTPPSDMLASSALFTGEAGPYTLPLGLQPNGQALYYRGEASLLTIAPPGKGKTQCHVLPTLGSYKGPAIVLDIKGECYDRTSEWRRDNVGPVLRFNPVDPETSSRYNPLAFVSDEPDQLWESSLFLAELLVVIRSSSDPTWETQGKDLLTLIIAYVTALYPVEERTMVRVLDLISMIGLAEMLEMVSAADSPFPGALRRAASRFDTMSKMASKQFQGILTGASQHLQLWEGPKLERVTSATDWSPLDFRRTPCPTLYLCIPPNAIETYAPILRVIIGQHVNLLMQDLKIGQAPILFLLDELPRLGKMQPIRDALEVGRQYGIKLWMIAQYPEQLTQAYPGVGEGMMEVCDVRMFMNPTATTADRIVKAFGTSRHVVKGGKPILEAADILGPAHRDSIFVLASNETPQILQKRFFHTQGP